MMNRILVVVAFFSLLFPNTIFSNHIVGGDVTYKCISTNATNRTTRYQFTFTMYRDDAGGGAPFDANARFGVFQKNVISNPWTFVRSRTAQPTNIGNVAYGDECVIVPPSIAVQKAIYTFVEDLSWDIDVYQITYQRCCRNAAINNIFNPNTTGAVFYIEVFKDAIRNCNNSPTFKSFPPLLICNNVALNFDHGGIDSEGDVLTYEFCTPLTAGGTDGATTAGDPNSCTGVTPDPMICLPPFAEVQFVQPTYTGTKPLGGNPLVVINPSTGLITGTPNTIGKFVVGVCVKEFRNGQQIGAIRRDFQFNITNCQGPSGALTVRKCANKGVTVNNVTYEIEGSYVQTLKSNKGCDSTLTITVINFPKAEGSITLSKCQGKPIVVNGQSYANAGSYTQTLISKMGCDSTLKISITDLPKIEASIHLKKCIGKPIVVNGQSYTNTGIFTQTLTSVLGCDSILTINISDYPKIETTISLMKCANKPITFNGQTYDAAGSFTQVLTSSMGCDSTLSITIKDYPKIETQLSLKKCDNKPLTYNGQIYTASGNYTQVLTSALGCDSTLLISISDLPKIESSLSLMKCSEKSIIVNGQDYNSEGSYTQVLTANNGCDSNLMIQILNYPLSFGNTSIDKCFGKPVSLNGILYNSAGQYTQTLVSSKGCDSTLNITVAELPKIENQLSFSICDDEIVLLNGQEYSSPGIYHQTLLNANGCDSNLTITILRNIASEKMLSFTLCNNLVKINNQVYNEIGQYTQILTNAQGCDSILIINILPCKEVVHYDLEACNAATPQESMIYEEFLPQYGDPLDCGNITATNIFRSNPAMNKHSCTPGIDGGTAMCISASTPCAYQNQSVTPLVFEVNLSPSNGNSIIFNQLKFYQKGPEKYQWISGLTGLNNYPTKYGIKVFKNGVEIFSKINIPTTLDWQLEAYNFTDNALFTTNTQTTFRVELLPYCAVGNGSAVSVWDIDEVSVFSTCFIKDNRKLSGKIIGMAGNKSGVEIRRYDGNIIKPIKAEQNGSFTFDLNQIDKQYTFRVNYNENFAEGINALDLVKIQMHILGINKFTHPLQYLAADVNNDQKVTAADLVELRKVILGIKASFSNNSSWIFVDHKHAQVESIPWKIRKYINTNPSLKNLTDLDFKAVKIGDVDALDLNNEVSGEKR